MVNNSFTVVNASDAEGLQTESKVQIFQNNEFGQVRTTLDDKGDPLFCLSDVCQVLELDKSNTIRRLDDGVCTTLPILDSLNRVQNANFVNEDGLYDVILDSRKPSAKKFRKWITSEVLPSIRKTGSYNVQQQIPRSLPDALRAYALEIEKNEQLSIENARLDTQCNQLAQENCELEEKIGFCERYTRENITKVNAWEQLVNTHGLFTISQFASSVGLTAQKVNKFLVEKGIITQNKQRPTYNYVSKGYFGIKERSITTQYGEKKIKQLLITSEGEEFLTDKLEKAGIIDVKQTTLTLF